MGGTWKRVFARIYHAADELVASARELDASDAGISIVRFGDFHNAIDK